MATNTPNYNLVKPGDNDFYNVAVDNGNMDIIDTVLKALADGQTPSEIISKIGYTPVNKAGDTLTGIVTAQNNTSYTTKQIRNITVSTLSPSGGSNGDIWIKYTP